MKHVNVGTIKIRSANAFRLARDSTINFFSKHSRNPGQGNARTWPRMRYFASFPKTVLALGVFWAVMLIAPMKLCAQKPPPVHDGTTIFGYSMLMPTNDMYDHKQLFKVGEIGGTASTPSIGPVDMAGNKGIWEVYGTAIGLMGQVRCEGLPGDNDFTKFGFTVHARYDRFTLSGGIKRIGAEIHPFDMQAGPRKIRIVEEQSLKDVDFGGQFKFEQPRNMQPVWGFLRKIKIDATHFNNLSEIRDAYNVWAAVFGLPSGIEVKGRYDTRKVQAGDATHNGIFSFGADKEFGWMYGAYALVFGGGWEIPTNAFYAEVGAKLRSIILAIAHQSEPVSKGEAQRSYHFVLVVDLADAYNIVFGEEGRQGGGHR